MEIYNKKNDLIFDGANLRNANLRNADLCDANLCNADLGDKIFIHIKGSRNDLYFLDTLRIGCEIYTIEHWLKNYEKIGLENEYTEKEINEYYVYIKMIEEHVNEKNNGYRSSRKLFNKV